MENIEVLRSKIIEKIFSTQNIGVLQAMSDLLTSINTPGNSDFILSETQKEFIHLAEEDVKYGRVKSDEELRKTDEEWMK